MVGFGDWGLIIHQVCVLMVVPWTKGSTGQDRGQRGLVWHIMTYDKDGGLVLV